MTVVNDEERSPLEQTLLAEARDDIPHADQKAGVLLAALGVGFAVVLGGQISSAWAPTALSSFAPRGGSLFRRYCPIGRRRTAPFSPASVLS